ncbi:hypothetical protein AMQ84_02995 [Paenibacillus riograndensis]|uniref:Uncharacterized protein n=1 Tax=Paenibacillus riograndensis TaxID=483937 RepID=A0A132UAA4_9BACL|nr:hypothetical protein AMQ84_02995 [Paenibacillus riograndensis]
MFCTLKSGIQLYEVQQNEILRWNLSDLLHKVQSLQAPAPLFELNCITAPGSNFTGFRRISDGQAAEGFNILKESIGWVRKAAIQLML